MRGVQGGSDEVGVKPTKVSQENIYQANILSRIVNRAPARPILFVSVTVNHEASIAPVLGLLNERDVIVLADALKHEDVAELFPPFVTRCGRRGRTE